MFRNFEYEELRRLREFEHRVYRLKGLPANVDGLQYGE